MHHVDFARLARGGAYCAIAAILLFFGVRLFGAMPQIFCWPDSKGYLLPAANFVSAAPFTGAAGRSVGYPALLYAILRFGEIRDIYFVQCALALGTGLAFAAALCLIVRETRYKTIGLLLAALFTLLLVGYQPLTNYVSFVMPEVLYIFLSVLITFLTLAAWVSRATNIKLTLFVLGVVLSVANCLVKPHWWGAAIVSIVLFGAAWATTLSRDRARSLAALFVAIAGSCALIFEQWSFSKNDTTNHTFGPLTLFCDHLDIARPTLEGNFPANAPEASRRALLAEIDAVLATKDPAWALNGGVNGGEKCLYSAKVRLPLSQIFARDQDLGRFAMSAFIDGVKHNPKAYLAKVARQFTGVLSAPFGNPALLESTDPDLHVPDLVAALPTALKDSAIGTISDGETLPVFRGRLAPVGHQATRILFISNHLAIYIFLAGLVAACMLLPSREAVDRTTALMFVACLTLYLSSLGVVAASHTFDYPRYVHTTVPLALLTYFSSILVLISATHHAFRLIAPAKGVPAQVE